MKNAFFFLVLTCFFISELKAQSGCNDPMATNYNSSLIINDGNCKYPSASIAPISSYLLDSALAESSGLIEWNGYLYTHNDNSDTHIYQLNKPNGKIVKTIPLPGVKNVDWEEISQDENYIYIGDFGNNAKGNRTDLKIYKVDKSSLLTTPVIETINFSYSNQTDFTAKPTNKTDFDCEAMMVTSDVILLFTKQWVSNKTSIYKLPNTPGTHVANLITTIDVSGLITGATVKSDFHLIALCGYSKMLRPFIYLIYDYKDTDFDASNKRKINFSPNFHQVEGIATVDGLEYFLINEKFKRSPFFKKPQKLHKLSLARYLGNYLGRYQH